MGQETGITYLGITVDTEKIKIHIQENKIIQMLQKLKDTSKHKKITLK